MPTRHGVRTTGTTIPPLRRYSGARCRGCRGEAHSTPSGTVTAEPPDRAVAASTQRTGMPRHTYPDDVVEASERSAAFFDLDKTVIARSSTFAFSRPFYAGGLLTRRSMLRGAYAHFFYQVNGADHEQMERMRRDLSRMAAGWNVQQVRGIVEETLEQLIGPLVYAEATELVREHREAGRAVVIVSASGSEVVEPIGEMLGADDVIATRMVVDDGRYTGEIDFYAYAENKALAIRELAARRGYDLAECYAYSDSVTDLPMLEVVGHPFAVNPDRALRRQAVAREWPVLEFRRIERLRSRFPAAPTAPGAPTVAAVAIGAGAATAGLVWYAARRRERADL